MSETTAPAGNGEQQRLRIDLSNASDVMTALVSETVRLLNDVRSANAALERGETAELSDIVKLQLDTVSGLVLVMSALAIAIQPAAMKDQRITPAHVRPFKGGRFRG